jgi:hypothetical protein
MLRIFSKIWELKNLFNFWCVLGFLPIKMEEIAKKCFVSSVDCYGFNVCSFGFVFAPSICARVTRTLLEDAKNVEKFVDDMLAHTSNFQGRLDTLENLFERICNAKIKLKPSEVRIGYSELTFSH